MLNKDEKDELQEMLDKAYQSIADYIKLDKEPPDGITCNGSRVGVNISIYKFATLDDDQKQLLSKISEIKDSEILNLIADGAMKRFQRYDKKLTPITKQQAGLFLDEIEELFEEQKQKELMGD